MSPCPRPLDPIDAEAVAAGAEPLFAPDSAAHAVSCASCGAAVARAHLLAEDLDGLSPVSFPVSDLAERVVRLRAFSPRERRTYALWRAPVLLVSGLAASGLALLLVAALTAADEKGLAVAALVPLLGFFRSVARWAPDLAKVAPSGLEALAQAFSQDRALGIAALLLLLPSAYGFTKVFSRARSRR
ncbi:MAG: hypothetical protein M3542_12650 [Acidobacteriota bacterium]|nr:hypothetical protein [Acidobacteriota bacterium]